MKLRTLAAFGCLGVILAACGGGDGGGGDLGTTPGATTGGGGTPAPGTVSSSPFQSVDSFVAYLRGLATDETSEPLALPDGAAPTSDTTEPVA